MLTTLSQSLVDRPDMEQAVRCLMSTKNTLATFNRLAENDPVLMERVLQASVAAMVNVQCVEAVDAELKRRAVAGN